LIRISVALLICTAGCGSTAPADCPPADAASCASICDAADKGKAATPPEKSSLTAFEKSVVDPMLEDVRAGVRPFDGKSIGICKGQGRDCDEFIGTDAGVVPEGKHMLRGEFRVPKTGEWTVDLSVKCKTTTKSGDSTTTTESGYDKSYKVSYVGEERGSRLSPLYKIDSPRDRGTTECKYTLTAPHPDGDKVYEGSWTVPEKGA